MVNYSMDPRELAEQATPALWASEATKANAEACKARNDAASETAQHTEELHKRLRDACRENAPDRAMQILQDPLINLNAYFDMNFGETLLQHACRFSSVEIVSALLQHKANVKTTNNNGGTALHIGCRYGTLPVVQLLIKSGANVNARDRNGQSSLLAATSFGRIDIATFLMSSGADVNYVSNQGDSALIAAASHGHLSLVSMLLDKVSPLMYSLLHPIFHPPVHALTPTSSTPSTPFPPRVPTPSFATQPEITRSSGHRATTTLKSARCC